ncbi:hypothetical protein CANTEDRAFT_114404 [Yamadazyma tenuis ATCC 10573]|uniref:Secreted protein n=1 Tax=Candida tenuis (strain ATCC 10573 / BCRC 21748 / CBS 615 / JCM 9827 / NBRC 10315 / NRRL Y-1498 / VKM Y-70) TaxID=590646 RepID=G3B743_CANTC|nr:uncharacterized protein CANTEDRAFT_114404 [Yamadazyma tenuis ATCC 10573]EGV63093.1 hypothetical protein CANTEDRAFT_114404 [Yamadazyma tenuis ATCC 10573]
MLIDVIRILIVGAVIAAFVVNAQRQQTVNGSTPIPTEAVPAYTPHRKQQYSGSLPDTSKPTKGKPRICSVYSNSIPLTSRHISL